MIWRILCSRCLLYMSHNSTYVWTTLTRLISCVRWLLRKREVVEEEAEKEETEKNKAGYTATLVACGWAGAVFELLKHLGKCSEAKDRKNIKKVKWGPTDRPTNQPTDRRTKRGVVSRSTRLKSIFNATVKFKIEKNYHRALVLMTSNDFDSHWWKRNEWLRCLMITRCLRITRLECWIGSRHGLSQLVSL